MDALLKLLAEGGLAVEAAETALDEGAHATARDRLDAAGDALAELRTLWPELSASERHLVARTAPPLKRRLEAAEARLPKRSALVEVVAEADPEQDEPPPDVAA